MRTLLLRGCFSHLRINIGLFCKLCGGHLMSGHQPVGLIDVYAATIPTLDFVPAVHVNYGEKVLAIKDGLPKMKDFPAELGGSGVAVPE